MLQRRSVDNGIPRWVWVFLWVAAASMAIGAIAGAAVRLPGLPYNLRELFWHGGSLLNLFCFGFFVAWPGVGAGLAAWVARHLPIRYLLLPLAVILLSAIAYLALYLSVTPESLHDVIGAPIITQPDRRLELLPGLAPLFAFADQSPALAAWLESMVRFSALYLPLPMLTALFLVLVIDFVTQSSTKAANLLLIAAVLALLWLAQSVVIEHAGTSNIAELVRPAAGIAPPGVLWIYVAVAVLSLAAVLLWAGLVRLLPLWLALAIGLAAIAAVLFLLQQGLAPAVVKYGQSFTALQFLITGQRDVEVEPRLIVIAWGSLQMVLQLLLAAGAWAVLPRREVKRLPVRR